MEWVDRAGERAPATGDFAKIQTKDGGYPGLEPTREPHLARVGAGRRKTNLLATTLGKQARRLIRWDSNTSRNPLCYSARMAVCCSGLALEPARQIINPQQQITELLENELYIG